MSTFEIIREVLWTVVVLALIVTFGALITGVERVN